MFLSTLSEHLTYCVINAPVKLPMTNNAASLFLRRCRSHLNSSAHSVAKTVQLFNSCTVVFLVTIVNNILNKFFFSPNQIFSYDNSCLSVSVPAPTLSITFRTQCPCSSFPFFPLLCAPSSHCHISVFSPANTSCQSSPYISNPTPTSSPVPFSAPHTPSYTPCCTPRRLSLALSLAESSTNLRDSTKTTSTSLGLVHLLLEHGISASVYNPRSWDRGLDASGASTPVIGEYVQRWNDRPRETQERQLRKRPDTLLLQPSTPPNSPRSSSKSASSTTPRPVFQFSPSSEDPPYYNTFLASKPARTILREVLGEAERERQSQTDDDSQIEMLNLRLVDKLKRFRTLLPHAGSDSSGSTVLAPFGSTGLGNSALGGGLPGLNAGLRRNRSYPAMVGASMAMKDPGGPPSTEVLIPHTMQTEQTQHTVHKQEIGTLQPSGTVVPNTVHIPQTLHALEAVSQLATRQRQATPNNGLQYPTSSGQNNADGPRT